MSRVQFESATEQLGATIRQLLDKVSVQEQDWHRAVRKLSTEMDCKVSGTGRGVRRRVPVLSDPHLTSRQLNRIELDSVKKQLDGRWRNITEKLQAQEAAEPDDAAVLRKYEEGKRHKNSRDKTFLFIVMEFKQHFKV